MELEEIELHSRPFGPYTPLLLLHWSFPIGKASSCLHTLAEGGVGLCVVLPTVRGEVWRGTPADEAILPAEREGMVSCTEPQ